MVIFATRVGAHRANGYRIGVVALGIDFELAAAAQVDGHIRVGEYREAFGASQGVFR